MLTSYALICATVPVIWLLGLLPIFGLTLDPMSILVPFLIFAIAVSHAVQMTSAWKQEMLQRLKTRTTNGEQKLEVELTNKSHAQRALQSITLRRERLREETGGGDAPDEMDLAEKNEELSLLYK